MLLYVALRICVAMYILCIASMECRYSGIGFIHVITGCIILNHVRFMFSKPIIKAYKTLTFWTPTRFFIRTIVGCL